ncbi:hypothetical protein ACFQ0D_19035, partial [Micromonospora zhanjiangensis]
GPLARAYRLTAQVLVKLGEMELAWLAADRAISTAADPRGAALAVVPLAQTLRALDRGRLAMSVTITTAHRLCPAPSDGSLPADPALVGTLLVQAALAAADCGDVSAAHELVARAGDVAHAEQPGHDSRAAGIAHAAQPGHDSHALGVTQAEQPGRGTGDDELVFGIDVVHLACALVAARLGDNEAAIAAHLRVTTGGAWSRLPAEHRAAHLIDISRAYLNGGDHRAAGHALVTADRVAPAETRLRPAARAALTAVLNAGPPRADVAGLAATVGLARP